MPLLVYVSLPRKHTQDGVEYGCCISPLKIAISRQVPANLSTILNNYVRWQMAPPNVIDCEAIEVLSTI